MSVTVKDNKAEWDRFVKNMETIGKGKRAEVGIFEAQGEDLVKYAATNEFGTSPGTSPRIPERSFLRAGIDEARRKKKVQAKVAELVESVILGKLTPLQALSNLGEWGANVVKKKIQAGPFTPLAESTKKRKGSDVPLIETRRLFNNITHRIK